MLWRNGSMRWAVCGRKWKSWGTRSWRRSKRKIKRSRTRGRR
jgi:hypothetical protein